LHPSLGVRSPEFDAISEATLAAAAALADRGFDVVIDTVLEPAEPVATLHRALGDREHRPVAVSCSLATLERCELERANRLVGLARGQLGRALGFADSIATSRSSRTSTASSRCSLRFSASPAHSMMSSACAI
jgi:chloramphenicol 3-O-phosphotransferase